MARIVFVNDQPDLAELVHEILEGSGHEVFALTNGHKAVDLIRDRHPDLVILDWLLDGITGEDILRQLRAEPSTKRIPILMASALPDAQVRGKLLGVDGVLGKPYREEDLLRAVNDLLRGSMRSNRD